MGRVFVNGREEERAGQGELPPDFGSRQRERLRVLAEIAEMLQQMEHVEQCQPYAAKLTGSAALREAREEVERRIEATRTAMGAT